MLLKIRVDNISRSLVHALQHRPTWKPSVLIAISASRVVNHKSTIHHEIQRVMLINYQAMLLSFTWLFACFKPLDGGKTCTAFRRRKPGTKQDTKYLQPNFQEEMWWSWFKPPDTWPWEVQVEPCSRRAAVSIKMPLSEFVRPCFIWEPPVIDSSIFSSCPSRYYSRLSFRVTLCHWNYSLGHMRMDGSPPQRVRSCSTL